MPLSPTAAGFRTGGIPPASPGPSRSLPDSQQVISLRAALFPSVADGQAGHPSRAGGLEPHWRNAGGCTEEKHLPRMNGVLHRKERLLENLCLANSSNQLSQMPLCQLHVFLLKIIPSHSIIYTWALAVTGLKINVSHLGCQCVSPRAVSVRCLLSGQPRWHCHPAACPLPHHRITECWGLEGTSVGHPVQPPAKAGSPTVDCRGSCPGGA